MCLAFLFLLRVRWWLGSSREAGCLGFSGCSGGGFGGVCVPVLMCAGLCVRAAGLGFRCRAWCVRGCPFFPFLPLFFFFPFVGWDGRGAVYCGGPGVVWTEQWSRRCSNSFWGPYGGCMSSYGGLVLVLWVFVICGWRVVRVSRVRRVLSRLGLLFLCGLLCFGFFPCVF